MTTLFQAPTVRDLASLLEKQDWSPLRSSLVPLQPAGTGPAFYCVHGGDGNLLLYRDLARRLGPEYPFYGLQPTESDGRIQGVPRIEELAAAYLREVREHQPDGPYYLGGFCVGGRIAFEMARQLQEEGQQVAFLAIIDSYNYNGQWLRVTPAQKVRYFVERIRFHLANASTLRGHGGFAYFWGKLRYGMGREAQSWLVKLSNLAKWPRSKNQREEPVLFAEEAYLEASALYKPQVYRGDATVFGFRKYFSLYPDPEMGWGNVVAGRINVVRLSTNPGGIFVEPFVEQLATSLKTSIRDVEAAATFCGEPVKN